MSKDRDILRALRWLDLIADVPAAKARLEALQQAEIEAVQAGKQAADNLKLLDERAKALDTRENAVAQRERDADAREARLKDAEAQYENRRHDQELSFIAAIDNHAKGVKDAHVALDAEWKNLHEQSGWLDAQSLELKERQQSLELREQGLDAREAALKQAQIEYAQKLAKLKELAG